jgi:hypothetical protein
MNKRITDRYGTVKKIKISYNTEISDEDFNNYCMTHRMNRNDAANQLKRLAIDAAEKEIDFQLTEINKGERYA